MITLFGNGCVNVTNNDKGGGGGNTNNAKKTPEAIVSIHLAGNGDDYSNYDDGTVESSESTEDDRGTDDNDIHHGAGTPAADSEEGDSNIDENVVTDNGKTNNDDNNNDEGDDTGNNVDGDSNVEESILDNNNTNPTTTLDDDTHVMASMAAFVEDDEEEDDGDYNNFCSDYDLDDNGIFDNDSINEGEAVVCMTLTDKWDSPPPDLYRYDDILLRHGVFDVGDSPSIHPNYFNGVLNESLGGPYTNDDPLTPTQTLHQALLKSSMRYKKGDVDKSINHYDVIKCKLQLIGIHNAIDYLNHDGVESLRLLLSSCDLTMLNMTTINSIKLELIFYICSPDPTFDL